MAKKKSDKKSDTPLLDEYMQHQVWMSKNYWRVLISKAREYITKDKNGNTVRRHRKGKKLPKFRPGDRDNY